MEPVQLMYGTITILFILKSSIAVSYPTACSIFCDGKLLDLVQNANLYKDSKTFVDMKMKFPVDLITSRFNNLLRNVEGTPSAWSLKRFMRRHFIGPGVELYGTKPHDWKEEPKVLSRIHDDRLKSWARKMNSYWVELTRKMRSDVRDHPDQYSLVYLPNSIVIPGERFTEFRYWDTYWILLGLLRSEMYITAKGILENLLLLVDKYGIVPGVGRIYHLTRSEPPLLLPMAKMYYEFTNDKQFIESNINTLESEFQYWLENRIVEIEWENNNVKLAHYSATIPKPRPEAYKEDLNIASGFTSNETRDEIYLDIRAASETGWTFSSRWLINNGTRSKKLTHIKTREIIPVDLNAILCWNAEVLSDFFTLIQERKKAEEYKQIAKDWQRDLTSLLWSEDDGAWFDYDKINNKKRKYFYASNLTPLWTMCYDKQKKDHIAKKVVNYLTNENITYYEGGIPLSTYETDHQYDFPTAIPPFQHIIIMGLQYTDNFEAKELAFKLAFNWVRANFKGYLFSGLMFDKYHCEEPGAYGGKTDYTDQIGYGWTNGVCLDLLYNYGSVIHSQGIHGKAASIFVHLSRIYVICVTCYSLFVITSLILDTYISKPINNYMYLLICISLLIVIIKEN